MLEHELTFLQSTCVDLFQLEYALAKTLLVFVFYCLSLSFFLSWKTKNPRVFSPRVLGDYVNFVLTLRSPGPWYPLVCDH